MPTYDYECGDESCGHGFSVVHGIKEDALVECPECKQDTLKRLIGPTHFALKGNGWYADGYSKTGSGNES